MKELQTAHKVLLFLTGVILVNIVVFVAKSSRGDEYVSDAANNFQRYILRTIDRLYILNNTNKQPTNSSKEPIFILPTKPDNKDSTIIGNVTKTPHPSTSTGGLNFNAFCKLRTADGVNGCTPQFKGYYDQYTRRCSSVIQKTTQPLCDCFPKTLVGWEKQTVSLLTGHGNQFKLDAKALGIEPGGHWRPRDCEPRQKVAIIVPYRNRPRHLEIYLHRLHQFLQRQQHEYQIFIIEQDKPEVFSRSSLMNIGFLEANKTKKFDCYIFSDVDLLPEDDRSMFSCFFSAVHLGAFVSKFKYKLLYDTIFGGISALSHEHVEKTNLFSNRFFGWGGEDDDLFHRLMSAGLTMYRYPKDISRVYMIVHNRDPTNQGNPVASDGTKHYQREVYVNNGLRQTYYEVVKKNLLPLITLIKVNILPPPPKEECLVSKGNDSSTREYLNCWIDENLKRGKLDCCKSLFSLTPTCCHKTLPTAALLGKSIKMVNYS